MKRFSVHRLPFAVLLLALAACEDANDSPSLGGGWGEAPGVPIAFTGTDASGSTDAQFGRLSSAQIGHPLSAGDLTTDNLASMTVYAHYTAAADFADAEMTTKPNFMFAQGVTKSGGVWSYTPLKYWPGKVDGVNLGKVSFFAVNPAPVTANGIELVATDDSYTGYPAFTVTPHTEAAKQLDLCVASALDQIETSHGGTVPLTFDHTLSKVKFAAQYASEHNNDFFGLVTRQLVLADIYNSNILRFTASSFTWNMPEDTNRGDYTLSVADSAIVDTRLLKNDETTGDAMLSTEVGTLMLLPQTLPDDAKLKLTLWVGDDEVVREIDMPQLTLEAGKQYIYNLAIADDNKCLSGVLDETVWDFDYASYFQHFVVPQDGTYKLEVWGAKGGRNFGNGAYAAGEIVLNYGQILYIYTGESQTAVTAAFNGGGAGKVSANNWSSAGGGATDIRVRGGAWNNVQSLNSRILVAGGGGGGAHDYHGENGFGGAGGGLTGYNGTFYNSNGSAAEGKGGGQTAGGAGLTLGYTTLAGSFGTGSDGGSNTNVGGGGGGGGYYGGSGGTRAGGTQGAAGGGGGSSFISGMTNCVAIDPTSTTNPRTQDTDTNGNPAALNYSETVFGTSSPTWSDGEEIIFANPSMIDGLGYEWNTGAKAETATGMPNWSKTDGSTMTGNTGSGHARVTLLVP